jgi:hypothetical protein
VAGRRVLPLVLVALASPPAVAGPRLFVDLKYQTDETLERCPTEAEFRAMITAQLGYDPFSTPSRQRVVARARALESGIRGFVEWYDESGMLRGQRALDSETRDCPSFMRAMSFALAVQIQLLAEEEEASGAEPNLGDPSPEQKAGPKAAQPSPAPATPASDQKSPKRGSASPETWQWLVGAGPALAFGLAPRTAVQGHIFTMARYDSLGVELGGEASFPSRHEVEEGRGFEQWTAAGSLSGCGFLWALSGCLVGDVGTLAIRGFGVDEPHSDAGMVAHLGLRLGLSHVLSGRWVGGLRVEAKAALVAWKVDLNDREVWRTPPVSLTLGADLAALFQ